MLLEILYSIAGYFLSIYKIWAVCSVTWNIGELLLRIAGVDLMGMFYHEPEKRRIGDGEVTLATQINRDSTLPQVKRREWYSIWDITCRVSVALVAFYYAILAHPLSFLHYTFLFNRIFSGPVKGIISALLLPFWPVVIFLNILIFSNNLSFLPMLNVEDPALESLQFFTNNLSRTASIIFDFSQEFGNYVGNFYILGVSPLGLQTMYWDTELTTKVFWREQLEKSGARIAREVARWDGAQLSVGARAVEEFPALLIKVANSCMGVGDLFLKRSRDFETLADVEKIFAEKYPGQQCILIEFLTAHPDLGVHSLDILTARDAAGHVQLVDVIVWSGSASETSHGATNCYMINPETETTCSYGKWYNPNFVNTSATGLGVKYPGTGEAVRTVLKTHKDLPLSWLTVVGWDCMVTDTGEMVFFEGNLAAWRCPRRLFLSLRSFLYFTRHISWIAKQ